MWAAAWLGDLVIVAAMPFGLAHFLIAVVIAAVGAEPYKVMLALDFDLFYSCFSSALIALFHVFIPFLPGLSPRLASLLVVG